MLKAKFDSVPIANFYKEYVPKSIYRHLHDNARRVMCMFGSTYCCEQLFSKMNYTKNKLCNRFASVAQVMLFSCAQFVVRLEEYVVRSSWMTVLEARQAIGLSLL